MRIIIDVNTEATGEPIFLPLELSIDRNADFIFELNGNFKFKVNCCEFQQAIDAFHIRSY
jgi:hypothetical protein